MPTIVENHSTENQDIIQERRDSTFTYEEERRDSSLTADMDRLSLSRSTDHLRTDSLDSGIGAPISFQAPAGVALAMKRTSSGSMNQHRASSASNISVK